MPGSMPSTSNIVELRKLLTERFPRLRPVSTFAESTKGWSTGIAGLDQLLGEGLPQGEITELIGSGWGSGTAQVIHAIIQQTASSGMFIALIDGADSFDVTAVESEVLSRLLWIRCRSVDEAL